MRTGLIARKIGMTRVYGGEGEHIPVTVMQIDACQVVGHRTVEKNGYTAMELGVGAAKVKRLAKADRGRFAKANVEPKQKTAEFRISDDMMVDVGAEISAAHFLVGQKVDVTGTTIGKGFAGAMKRHNFGGLRATHGVSVTHRSHGSTGQRQDPGRVFKNKRMAGHMGDVQCTTQNIEVVRVDEARGLILLKGAVPGSKGGWVMIRDAVREAPPKDLPKPAAIKAQASANSGDQAPADASQDTTGAGADQ